MGRKITSRGFTLIECILFLLLTSLLVMLTLQWIMQAYINMKRCGAQNDARIALYAAHDLLIRDMREAPDLCNAWKETGDPYIWHTKQGDVGWELREESLCRITGTYDTSTHSWRSQHTALVAEGISIFEVQLDALARQGVPRWEKAHILLAQALSHKDEIRRIVFFRAKDNA